MIILGLAFLIVGAMTLITEGDYLFAGRTQGEVNEIVLADESISEYLDEYVSIDIYGTMEIFAETKHTVNAIPTGTDYHYVVNGAESRAMTILTTVLTTLLGLFFLLGAFGKFIFAKKKSPNTNQGQGTMGQVQQQPASWEQGQPQQPQPTWEPAQASNQNQVPQYSVPETSWQPGAPVQSQPAQQEPEQPSWQPAQPEQLQPSWQPAQPGQPQPTDIQEPVQPAEPTSSGDDFEVH